MRHSTYHYARRIQDAASDTEREHLQLELFRAVLQVYAEGGDGRADPKELARNALVAAKGELPYEIVGDVYDEDAA
jgi:hypothetical protein